MLLSFFIAGCCIALKPWKLLKFSRFVWVGHRTLDGINSVAKFRRQSVGKLGVCPNGLETRLFAPHRIFERRDGNQNMACLHPTSWIHLMYDARETSVRVFITILAAEIVSTTCNKLYTCLDVDFVAAGRVPLAHVK